MGIRTLHKFVTDLALASQDLAIFGSVPADILYRQPVNSYNFHEAHNQGADAHFRLVVPERYNNISNGSLVAVDTVRTLDVGGRSAARPLLYRTDLLDLYETAHADPRLWDHYHRTVKRFLVENSARDKKGYLLFATVTQGVFMGAVDAGYLEVNLPDHQITQQKRVEALSPHDGEFVARDGGTVADALVEYLLYRIGSLSAYSSWSTGDITASLVRDVEVRSSELSRPRTERTKRPCELRVSTTGWGAPYRATKALGAPLQSASYHLLAFSAPWDGLI